MNASLKEAMDRTVGHFFRCEWAQAGVVRARDFRTFREANEFLIQLIADGREGLVRHIITDEEICAMSFQSQKPKAKATSVGSTVQILDDTSSGGGWCFMCVNVQAAQFAARVINELLERQ